MIETVEILFGGEHNIKWSNTGEILSRVDAYDWTEKAEGEDQLGCKWEGYAVMSCGEIIEIEEPELLTI